MSAPGYDFDTAYTPGWYREQSPIWTSFVADWSGAASPDLDRPFRYLDLGCGLGRTATWVAAFHPQAEVWGVDASPTHIALAQRHTARLGIDNATFVAATFDKLLQGDLPQFDYIGLHGIWSWVPEPIRDQILQILDNHLVPGGHFYNGYNALPGKIPDLPLQRLMRHLRGGQGGARHEFAQARELLQRLQGHGYFGRNNQTIDRILNEAHDVRYLMHEYWVDHWQPSLLSEMASDLRASGLSFLGSTDFNNNVPTLALAPELQPRIEGIADEVLRETLRDYLVNTAFRRDVFVRGRVPLQPREQRDRLLARQLFLGRPREQCGIEFQAPAGTITLDGAQYPPILDALAKGPSTGAVLCEQLDLSPQAMMRSMGVLAAARYVDVGPAPSTETEGRVGSINGAAVREGGDDVYVGSVAGNCHRVSRVECLLLEELQNDDAAARALARLQADGLHLTSSERALDTEALQLEEMQRIHGKLLDERLPMFRLLGVPLEAFTG